MVRVPEGWDERVLRNYNRVGSKRIDLEIIKGMICSASHERYLGKEV